jgi:hypothetical protein
MLHHVLQVLNIHSHHSMLVANHSPSPSWDTFILIFGCSKLIVHPGSISPSAPGFRTRPSPIFSGRAQLTSNRRTVGPTELMVVFKTAGLKSPVSGASQTRYLSCRFCHDVKISRIMSCISREPYKMLCWPLRSQAAVFTLDHLCSSSLRPRASTLVEMSSRNSTVTEQKPLTRLPCWS